MARAPRNRTLTLSEIERPNFQQKVINLNGPCSVSAIRDKSLCQNLESALEFLPKEFVDLLVIDPPYNLTKTFGTERGKTTSFKELSLELYADWMDTWFSQLMPLLKPSASVYVCGDWKSSSAIHLVMEKYLIVRNRISWEREKGRGAKANWKNCSEDIWFGTKSDTYCFNLDAVRVRRKVIAPYKDSEGNPKDWKNTSDGNVRETSPSNFWTDLTVPFWSMPENTDHPTQKPEKLIAKLILASSNKGDFVLDPFMGSGTTSVVAKKLDRHYLGIEKDIEYCAWAEKRLAQVDHTREIQGYDGGVFWERNSAPIRR